MGKKQFEKLCAVHNVDMDVQEKLLLFVGTIQFLLLDPTLTEE